MKGRDTAKHMVACNYIKENIATIAKIVGIGEEFETEVCDILRHYAFPDGRFSRVADVFALFSEKGVSENVRNARRMGPKTQISVIVSIDEIDNAVVLRELNAAARSYSDIPVFFATNVIPENHLVEHLQGMGVKIIFLGGKFERFYDRYDAKVDLNSIINL